MCVVSSRKSFVTQKQCRLRIRALVPAQHGYVQTREDSGLTVSQQVESNTMLPLGWEDSIKQDGEGRAPSQALPFSLLNPRLLIAPLFQT